MDPIKQTPTEPIDYATLSAGYGALLGTLLLAARRREESEPLRATDIAPLGLATFALSKLLTKEKVETWMREPFVEEGASGHARPKGTRLRYAVGELLTCTRCAGAWSALGLVALRVARPREARVVTTVLGASATNDFLHAGFSLLCGRANMEQRARARRRSVDGPPVDGPPVDGPPADGHPADGHPPSRTRPTAPRG